MTKNFKLSFLLTLIFSAIIVAWNTIGSFFNGVGLNFVALFIIVGILIYFMLTDGYVRNRFKDIFVLASALTILEFLEYVVFEFGTDSIKVINAFREFQIFLSIMGLLFLIYIAFRYILEEKGIKLSFIEWILGNKPHKKVKTNKELANGSLEDKPKSAEESANDNVVIEETKTEE